MYVCIRTSRVIRRSCPVLVIAFFRDGVQPFLVSLDRDRPVVDPELFQAIWEHRAQGFGGVGKTLVAEPFEMISAGFLLSLSVVQWITRGSRSMRETGERTVAEASKSSNQQLTSHVSTF